MARRVHDFGVSSQTRCRRLIRAAGKCCCLLQTDGRLKKIAGMEQLRSFLNRASAESKHLGVSASRPENCNFGTLNLAEERRQSAVR
jgi:hypothetical protein